MTDNLQPIVRGFLEILASILAPLVVMIFVKVLQKLHLDVSGQQQARLLWLTQQAILEAQEWAARSLKAGQTVDGMDKLDRATKSLTAAVPSLTEEKAEDLIHSELPKMGLGVGQTPNVLPVLPVATVAPVSEPSR